MRCPDHPPLFALNVQTRGHFEGLRQRIRTHFADREGLIIRVVYEGYRDFFVEKLKHKLNVTIIRFQQPLTRAETAHLYSRW